MLHDSVVDEVRAAREAYAKRFDYDLDLICQDLKDQAEKNGMKLVTLPPRRARPVETFPAYPVSSTPAASGTDRA